MVDILYLEKERTAMLQSVSNLIDRENSRRQEFDKEKRSKIQEIKDLVNRLINLLRVKEREIISQVHSEFEMTAQ